MNRFGLRRRALLLGGAGVALPVPASSGAGAAREAVIPARGVHPRPLVFPGDFGAHPYTRLEWWYVTGVLDNADAPAGAPAFGFQITFFRSRTDVPADHPSRFAATQLYFAHVALTDVQARTMRHDQRIARRGFGRAGAAQGDTQVAIGTWQLAREGSAAAAFSGGAGVAAVDTDAPSYRAQIASDTGGFAFDFALRSTQPLLLQGDAGFSRKGPRPEQASHYYSVPHLAVNGTLRQEGKVRRIRGQAWLDHEWSDALLDPQAVGWDWIGMNLDDGSALTAFRLRRADGSALYAGGSFRRRDGAVTAFAPDAVRFVVGRTWRSPASNAVYPVTWRLETPAGRFEVASVLDNQELDSRNSTGAIYWEGLSELKSASGQRVGRGYLEMTGYAGALRL